MIGLFEFRTFLHASKNTFGVDKASENVNKDCGAEMVRLLCCDLVDFQDFQDKMNS